MLRTGGPAIGGTLGRGDRSTETSGFLPRRYGTSESQHAPRADQPVAIRSGDGSQHDDGRHSGRLRYP
jgi:hypothetical protein